MSRGPAETAALAAALQAAIEARCPDGFITEVEESTGRAGGGSMPLVELPSHAVRLRLPELPLESGGPGGSARPAGAAGGPGGWSGPEPSRPARSRGGHHGAPGGVTALEAELRRAPIPVVARVSQDSIHLDVLALDPEEVDAVADSVAWAIDAADDRGCRRPRARASGDRRGSGRSWPLEMLGARGVMPDRGCCSGRSGRLTGLSCSGEQARPLTLGTAGHIDHGKTTLVKALTGRDTDRLKEEKERGISIELGFAELALPSGRRLSVVDVPGHERFVKTMVAGATGIDLFLLVVAADDGVMPQTREHLRIIELLDIPTGLVALTKIDMVDPDLAELAKADVEEFLLTTRYAEAPIVMVSGVTGEGLPELLATLDRLGATVPPRPSYPATRMPVDRVFSLKGIGTVITGTLWSGSLSAEDTVAILPPRTGQGSGAGREVRVRSVQVHDREVAAAGGGQRVALNLTGVDRDEVERGQWVVKDPSIEPTYLADVRLSLLPMPRPPCRGCCVRGWITAPPRSWPRWCLPTARP